MAHNTKTNVTTYTQSSSLDTADFQHIFDNVNTIVTTYPSNGTATLEARESIVTLSDQH